MSFLSTGHLVVPFQLLPAKASSPYRQLSWTWSNKSHPYLSFMPTSGPWKQSYILPPISSGSLCCNDAILSFIHAALRAACQSHAPFRFLKVWARHQSPGLLKVQRIWVDLETLLVLGLAWRIGPPSSYLLRGVGAKLGIPAQVGLLS